MRLQRTQRRLILPRCKPGSLVIRRLVAALPAHLRATVGIGVGEAGSLFPGRCLLKASTFSRRESAHVPEYHLRVDDIVRCVYGLTGSASPRPYELTVGDVIKIESMNSPNLNREALIQPDGTITVPLLGQVSAAGRTLSQSSATTWRKATHSS